MDSFDLILDSEQPWRFRGRVHLQGRDYLDAENLFVPLANDLSEPIDRLRTIAEATATAKAQERAIGYGPMASALSEAAHRRSIPPPPAPGPRTPMATIPDDEEATPFIPSVVPLPAAPRPDRTS